MNLRSVAFVAVLGVIPSYAQVRTAAQTNSASHVSAEMTKGKLNSADSKAGDTIVIKLKDDVRSNGELILKKGTAITGVVRNVKPSMPSIIEIEWLVPAVQGHAVQSLSFTLQSVIQLASTSKQEESDAFEDELAAASVPVTPVAARPMRGTNHSLLDSIGVPAASTPSAAAAMGRSNVALLSMPSVVAVDQQTTSSIESSLGTPSSGQLFRVGHGELISAIGARQSLDLYSHLGNDTLITSPGKNFQISSGAQMHMLVGVNRK